MGSLGTDGSVRAAVQGLCGAWLATEEHAKGTRGTPELRQVEQGDLRASGRVERVRRAIHRGEIEGTDREDEGGDQMRESLAVSAHQIGYI